MEDREIYEDRNIISMYPVLNAFFQAYLTERDVEKTLSLVTDDIYSIGTGEGEVAVNKEQFERLLRMDTEAIPTSIMFHIKDYTETAAGDGRWKCFCNVETAVSQGQEELVFYKTRMSACFIKVNGRYLAEILHMSEASRSQEKEEFFPLRFISDQAEVLKGPAQRELIEIASGMMPGGVIGGYIDEGFPLYVINDTMLSMMGYTYEDFVEETKGMVLNSIYEEDVPRVNEQVRRRLEEGREYAIEYRVKRKDGGHFWVYDIGRKIIAEDGRSAIISVLIDISKDMKKRKQLMEESLRDYLTGVYNRKGGEALIAQKMPDASPYIYFMIDLDNFKKVNDIYGHNEGDNILRYVGRMLRESFRQTDVVVRVGGDEFAVLACSCNDVGAIRQKAEWLIRKYYEEIGPQYPKVHTSISIGGIYGVRPRTFLELYKLADGVLYGVKQSGKGQCMILRADD